MGRRTNNDTSTADLDYDDKQARYDADRANEREWD